MSIFGAFTGSDAKKGALATKQANDATANAGYAANQGYLDQGHASATGRMQPFAQQGQQANQQYGNLLGLHGSAAQVQARQAYQGWNPYLQGDMDASARSISRRANASGSFNSGLNMLAQHRAGMEIGSRDFGAYADRLGGQGQMGYGAAGTMAGMDMGRAQGQIGNRNMLSGHLMGNEGAYNQQYQQANTAGLTNIFGLSAMGLDAAKMAFGVPPTPKSGGNNYASPPSYS